MNKHYTAEFKARVAIEAIKGQRSVEQIAVKYGVQANEVISWRDQFLEASTETFKSRDYDISAQRRDVDDNPNNKSDEENRAKISGFTVQLDTDVKLFRRVKSGDEVAFRTIYDRHHKIIHSLAYKMLKSSSAADDTVQYVFTKLWMMKLELNISTSLRSYLHTMARNYILNYIRNRNRELVYNYITLQQDELVADEISEQMERSDIAGVIDGVINRLPSQKREILSMRKSGYSNPEIAQRLNISINTVRSHYQEGLKMIRKEIGTLITLFYALLTLF